MHVDKRTFIFSNLAICMMMTPEAKAEEAPLFSLNCPDQLGSVGADVCNQHSQE